MSKSWRRYRFIYYKSALCTSIPCSSSRFSLSPGSSSKMKQEDLRALTPLIYSHVTPYGTFRLNLTERIPIEQEAS